MAHPRPQGRIQRVRQIILAADPRLSEQVKWNAPSFGYDGGDRITFRLQPGDRVELIFHRGAKVKDHAGFTFTDDSGLLRFLAPDRAMLVFADVAEVDGKAEGLAGLVRGWMQAT